MVSVTTLFIDDSGTRHPDHEIDLPKHGHDWFSLGGVLIDDENIPIAREKIATFREAWTELGNAPLHSCEIRSCSGAFKWLGVDEEKRKHFLGDLENLLLDLPVLGIACVIDRQGYNRRYRQKYGRQSWALCKTSFAVVVERATKFAKDRNRKLRVHVEATDKNEDRLLKGYYQTLKNTGHWFNPVSSEKYEPVKPEEYQQTLYDFKIKQKTSPLVQIADMYLWPMCMGGYEENNRPYNRLKERGKLIDCSIPVETIETRGIKYSCFNEA